jgi:nicotinate-nucleotide--dimethylbenzimidazole phosphoribosyltransferase
MSLLNETISKITPQNSIARAKAKVRLDQLTMPHWALGRLMDLALDLAGITGTIKPQIIKKVVVIMAADHGVTAEGVSKYPSEVTQQMVMNFIAGGAGINALARRSRTEVVVVDMGVAADLGAAGDKVINKKVAMGTKNMAQGPAMTKEEAIRSIEAGIEIAYHLKDADVLGTGEMGIGNTSPSAAIVSCITGKSVAEVTGRGTGIDDGQLKTKIAIIEKSLKVNNPDRHDGLDVLSKVGGFEIGGLAGLIIGAAALKKPVVVDGFISTAAALIAQSLAPATEDYMIAAHNSVEKGHRAALEKLGKKALMDLDFRLGEGTGAALAMNFVEAAVGVLTEVATFEEAAVSGADK